MGRRSKGMWLAVLSTAFVIVFLAFSISGGQVESIDGSTIYVPDDYSTIQAAVDAASPGDTIVVRDGTYPENADVNKRLTIRSANGPASCTVQAADPDDHAFEVRADYVEISGFTVTGTGGAGYAGYAAIYVGDAQHCNISDNYVADNWNGIYLEGASNNTLNNNTVTSSSYQGITLMSSYPNSSDNNTLTNNNVTWTDRYEGIILWGVSGNTLRDNTMSDNKGNFGVVGYELSDFIHDIDASNLVDGKPIYYWVAEHDKEVPNDAGYVAIVDSTNITVKDLTLTNNRTGVKVAYSSDSRIENVTASNNFLGILVSGESSNVTMVNNDVDSNYYHGIHLSGSNHTLTDNSITNNSSGLTFWPASNCTMRNNTISGNGSNFHVQGFEHSHFIHDIDASNSVDGKPIYYWVGESDKEIPSDAGYVGVIDSTNITVKDLTLTNNGEGVLFVNSDNSRIENVEASNNRWGIYLWGSSTNTLINNNVSSNEQYGIVVDAESSNNTIVNNTVDSNYGDGFGYGIQLSGSNHTLTDNTITNNGDGLAFSPASNCTLRNNIMSGNDYNFSVGGSEHSHFIHDIDTSNLVDGKPIYYWIGEYDREIPGDAGYVGVVDSTNITVRDLTLTNNGEGVLFGNSNDSTIENVDASNNRLGIHLWGSSNNTLINSNVSSNDRYGIIMGDSSDSNTLVDNTISWNEAFGILLMSSSNTLVNNIVSHNGAMGMKGMGGVDPGIQVGGTSATGNTISTNSIHSNHGEGIELVRGGNTELPAPIVDSVGGSVSGHSEPVCYPCTVEVFSDYEDEGRIYHGSTSTNDDGTWTYPGAVTGPNVTATITDASGNTSEFSLPFAYGSGRCGDVDCDGDVDAVDALFIAQYVVALKLPSDQCPPPEGHLYLPAGDVDCDDDVDAVDALFVLQHVVGLRPELCVCGITPTEIIIGAHSPLSGLYGAVYSVIPKAQEAYYGYVNDTQGGVCGRQIVLKVEDDGYDPAQALEVTKKLVEQDKVFAIVGAVGDLPHSGVWEYLNDKGIPDILVSAGAHKYGADPQGHPWTVQMMLDYTTEGTFFGQYISENLPDKKVAILYENSDFGWDGLAGVKDGLDPDKNEIVSEQSFEITAVSIASQVTNMKDAGAEVVVLYSTPGFTAQAVKQADRLGWHPQWFMSYVNSDQIIFQFISPELLEDAISFQAVKLADWTDDPAVARHYQIMGDYGGPAPTNFSIYAQSLAELSVEIFSRACDNLTREGLMDALESIEDFQSDLLLPGVNVSFSETDHTGLQTGRMLRVIVVDGEGEFEYFGPLYVFEGE